MDTSEALLLSHAVEHFEQLFPVSLNESRAAKIVQRRIERAFASDVRMALECRKAPFESIQNAFDRLIVFHVFAENGQEESGEKQMLLQQQKEQQQQHYDDEQIGQYQQFQVLEERFRSTLIRVRKREISDSLTADLLETQILRRQVEELKERQGKR